MSVNKYRQIKKVKRICVYMEEHFEENKRTV